MESKYKKLKVDGKTVRVFLATSESDLPEDIKDLVHLHGIEIIDASPEEFLDDYEKRYGALPYIGQN